MSPELTDEVRQEAFGYVDAVLAHAEGASDAAPGGQAAPGEAVRKPLASRLVPGSVKRAFVRTLRYALRHPFDHLAHPMEQRFERQVTEARDVAQAAMRRADQTAAALQRTRLELGSTAPESRLTRPARVAGAQSGLKIGIAKPDFGFVGGYERVIERIAAELQRQGHAVTWIRVDALDVPNLAYGVELPLHVAPELWELQRYAGLIETFAGIDTSPFDLMISTQPPSFAIRHPRHLSVFSHHHRIYYDLEDVHAAAGLADPELHGRIADAVRRLDQPLLEKVSYFLAASEEVAERLARFNGLTENVGVYHAGVAFRPDSPVAQPRERGDDWYAISVGRHEFPKRAELFIQALKYLPEDRGVLVGGGTRMPWLRALDARLGGSSDLDRLAPEDLWLNSGETGLVEYQALDSNVEFVEDAASEELAELYAGAGCAVAPAFLEDYGLTAVEAMTYGLPLIVCSDGGGLTWFVEDGVTGFVVEPTGRAIADAMSRLRDDPKLAAEMGREARERASRFTWVNALGEIRRGLDRVTG